MRNFLNFSIIWIILFASPALGDVKVNLTCEWIAYDYNTETFHINLDKKEVLWVEEETTYKLTEYSIGYLKFSGVKSTLQGNDGSLIFNTNINFKINRINGSFYVYLNEVKTRKGKCTLGKLF